MSGMSPLASTMAANSSLPCSSVCTRDTVEFGVAPCYCSGMEIGNNISSIVCTTIMFIGAVIALVLHSLSTNRERQQVTENLSEVYAGLIFNKEQSKQCEDSMVKAGLNTPISNLGSVSTVFPSTPGPNEMDEPFKSTAQQFPAALRRSKSGSTVTLSSRVKNQLQNLLAIRRKVSSKTPKQMPNAATNPAAKNLSQSMTFANFMERSTIPPGDSGDSSSSTPSRDSPYDMTAVLDDSALSFEDEEPLNSPRVSMRSQLSNIVEEFPNVDEEDEDLDSDDEQF